MPAARRVLLAPPEAWDDERLLQAARELPTQQARVCPGDELAGLVVVGVEPAPGAALDRSTELEIQPRPRATGARHVDLAILLDRSESMGEAWSARHTRLDAALEALRAFLGRPGGAVGQISVFAYARQPLLAAGPAAPADLALPELEAPHGRSETGAALNAALAHLAVRARDDASQAILLLSDGVGDVEETRRCAQRAARLKVPVHVLVFAPETDEVFAELAKTSGGSVQRASLPLDIEFVHEAAP